MLLLQLNSQDYLPSYTYGTRENEYLGLLDFQFPK